MPCFTIAESQIAHPRNIRLETLKLSELYSFVFDDCLSMET
jgi:hypothetical protein